MPKGRILIVEGDSVVALDLQERLGALGYIPLGPVSSGEMAVEAAVSGHPNLIFIDIILEGKMNGLQVANAIGRQIDIPIIFLTSYPSEMMVDQGNWKESFGFLIKPFDNNQLRISIENTFYQYKRNQKLRLSAQRFRGLVQGLPNGLVLFDSNGLLLEWNRAVEIITEISSSDAIGSLVWDVLEKLLPKSGQNPERIKSTESMLRDFLKEIRVNKFIQAGEFQIQSINGIQKTIRIHVFPVELGEARLFAAEVQDISSQRLAESGLKREIEKSEGLAHVSLQVNSSTSLENTLSTLLSECKRVLKSDMAGIALLQDDRKTIKLEYIDCAQQLEEFRGITFPVSALASLFQLTATSSLYWDGSELHDSIVMEIFHRLNSTSVAITPMWYQKKWIGVLGAATTEISPRLTMESTKILEAFGSQAAVAIASARMFEELQQRNRHLEILARISTSLRKARNQQEILQLLLEETITVLNADSGMAYLLDEWEVLSSFGKGIYQKDLQNLFRIQEAYHLQMKEDSVVSFDHLQETLNHYRPNEFTEDIGIHSALLVALHTSQSTYGLLLLGFQQFCELTVTDHQTLLSVAEIGGNALQRSGMMEMLEQRVRDRTRELTALYDISVIIGQGTNLLETLRICLQKTTAVMEADASVIYRVDSEYKSMVLLASDGLPNRLQPLMQKVPLSEQLQEWVKEGCPPKLVDAREINQHPYDSSLSKAFTEKILLPIRIQNSIFGVLMVLWKNGGTLAIENIGLLTNIAERIATAIQADDFRSRSELSAIREERQRVARDLHDSVSQSIYSVTLLAESAKDLARMGSAERLATRLDDLSAVSLQALKEMRLLLYELRRTSAQEIDFQESIQNRLESVEQRSNIQTELQIDKSIELNQIVQGELYQITNEALNNSLKHSQANRIVVRLERSLDAIRLTIEDNGIGFDTQVLSGNGIGIKSMRERASSFGGLFTVTSEPTRGTVVLVEIPIEEGFHQERTS